MLNWGPFVPQGPFGNFWRPFGWSQLGESATGIGRVEARGAANALQCPGRPPRPSEKDGSKISKVPSLKKSDAVEHRLKDTTKFSHCYIFRQLLTTLTRR